MDLKLESFWMGATPEKLTAEFLGQVEPGSDDGWVDRVVQYSKVTKEVQFFLYN